jgi:dolichol-phosphate mannosyltransferase
MEGLFNQVMTQLSVVIPVYNESSLVEELIRRVTINVKKITEDFEIIIVDDGSKDQTWELIGKEAKKENRVKGVKFSRNFGHHYAITAGLHTSTGDWVVVMDGDLQDRPEVIPDLYSKAQSGFDVVFVSRKNRPESIGYRILQRVYYSLLNKMSGMDFDSKQANFSIISRKVVEGFKMFTENARFYGSVIKWLGFSRGFIEADHGVRFSGSPSYTFRKRINLARDVIIAFSDRPLRFITTIGASMAIISLFLVFIIVFRYMIYGFSVEGWASIVVAIFLCSGIILTQLGIIGIYIGSIFREVKSRPLYVIAETIGK